jgi:hypothetical protein
MEDSKYVHINTSKLFAERRFKEIPHHKPIKRTRMFTYRDYDNIHGLELYRMFSYFFGNNIVPIDRTGTITTPFNTTLLPILELPKYEVMTKTYAECCDDRAKQILDMNKPIYVFYGGGIDSMTVLAALIKNATPEQYDNINIVMSNDSVLANQDFYNEVILGKFNIVPSQMFPRLLGQPNVVCVTGEHNDELFGVHITQALVVKYGDDVMHEPVTEESLCDKMNRQSILLTDEEKNNISRCVDLLQQVVSKSPVKIATLHQFFWWTNFVLTWNVAYTRIMSFASSPVTPDENYFSFFGSKDFQLWAMNNHTNLVGATWNTIKQPAKDYIAEYCYDNEDFRVNAVKRSCLTNVTHNKSSAFVIDSNMIAHKEATNLFLESNSFV